MLNCFGLVEFSGTHTLLIFDYYLHSIVTHLSLSLLQEYKTTMKSSSAPISTVFTCALCCAIGYSSKEQKVSSSLKPLVVRRRLPATYSDGRDISNSSCEQEDNCIVDFFPDDVDTCLWSIILDTSTRILYVVFCTPLDMLANLSVSPAMLSKDITVQSGLHAVVSNTYRNLKTHITNLIAKHEPMQIIASGHSLGGCLAQLFALRYYNDTTIDPSISISVVTFGAPMAAYSTVATLSVTMQNFILPNDPMPRLPYVYNSPNSRAVRSLQNSVGQFSLCLISGSFLQSNLPFLHHYAKSLRTLLSDTSYLPRCIPLGTTLLINGDHTIPKTSEGMRSHVSSIDTVVQWGQHEIVAYIDALTAMSSDLPAELLQWVSRITMLCLIDSCV